MPETWQDPYLEAFIEKPPLPRMVVRVGVSGHRDESEDATNLRQQVLWALQEISKIALEAFNEGRAYFDPKQEKPILRLISPLAEGADRLVAKVALDKKYELQCPIPFSIENYKKDFPDSVAEFDLLLHQAKKPFILDYPYTPEDEQPEGYQAAGRLVVRQSDVLIAIWNGRPAKGIGGTGLIVQEALAYGIPTLRVDSQQPHTVTLVNPKRMTETEPDLARTSQQLREHLRQNLLPHFNANAEKKKEQEKEKRDLEKFLAEELLLESRTVKRNEETILAKAFRVSDLLANRYSPAYRGSYRAIYLLGAAAVFFAYLGSTAEQLPSFMPEGLYRYLRLEILLLSTILVLTGLGWLQRWHKRWLDYRHLAESLRIIKNLLPFGLVTPFFQVPAHLAKGDPRKTWFHFYFRALVRDVGLASPRMEGTELYHLLDKAIKEQVDYHERTKKTSHANHKFWHNFTQMLFGVAVIACLFHLREHGHNDELKILLLNLAVIVLPAFAGAIGAALHHGESERIANRSEALKEQFGKLASDLKELKPAAGKVPSYRDLARIAEQFSILTQSELTDWRFLFLARPLTLPA
jgi:hypothetical protein